MKLTKTLQAKREINHAPVKLNKTNAMLSKLGLAFNKKILGQSTMQVPFTLYESLLCYPSLLLGTS